MSENIKNSNSVETNTSSLAEIDSLIYSNDPEADKLIAEARLGAVEPELASEDELQRSLRRLNEKPSQLSKLGEILIKRNYINKKQLESLLAKQAITKQLLGTLVINAGFLSRKELVKILLEISPEKIYGEQHFSFRCPSEILISLKAMIITEDSDNKTVILSSISPEKTVIRALKPYYPDMDLKFAPVNLEQLNKYLQELQNFSMDEDNVLDKLLRRCIVEGYSDLHIEPESNCYTVLARYLGERTEIYNGTLEEYTVLAAKLKDKAKVDISERRITQDGSFPYEYNGKSVDFRFNTAITPNGEKIILRLLDPESALPNLNKVGITRVGEWRKGVSNSFGICLIVGETGSGKTTTLNSTIKEQDRIAKAIYSVEEPIEYRIQGITQVSVNETIGMTFDRILRGFLRADPDMIFIGEIRDIITAKIAARAGETGHMVIASTHAGTPNGAIGRIRDLGVPVNDFAHLMRSIMAQKLIKTLCVVCKGQDGGCPHCKFTRYGGRTAITEVVYFESKQEVIDALNGNVWWPTLADDAAIKVSLGLTDAKAVADLLGYPGIQAMDKAGIAIPDELRNQYNS